MPTDPQKLRTQALADMLIKTAEADLAQKRAQAAAIRARGDIEGADRQSFRERFQERMKMAQQRASGQGQAQGQQVTQEQRAAQQEVDALQRLLANLETPVNVQNPEAAVRSAGGGSFAQQQSIGARQRLGTAPSPQGGGQPSINVGGQTFQAPDTLRATQTVTRTEPREFAPGIFLPAATQQRTVSELPTGLTQAQLLSALQTQAAQRQQQAQFEERQKLETQRVRAQTAIQAAGVFRAGDVPRVANAVLNGDPIPPDISTIPEAGLRLQQYQLSLSERQVQVVEQLAPFRSDLLRSQAANNYAIIRQGDERLRQADSWQKFQKRHMELQRLDTQERFLMEHALNQVRVQIQGALGEAQIAQYEANIAAMQFEMQEAKKFGRPLKRAQIAEAQARNRLLLRQAGQTDAEIKRIEAQTQSILRGEVRLDDELQLRKRALDWQQFMDYDGMMMQGARFARQMSDSDRDFALRSAQVAHARDAFLRTDEYRRITATLNFLGAQGQNPLTAGDMLSRLMNPSLDPVAFRDDTVDKLSDDIRNIQLDLTKGAGIAATPEVVGSVQALNQRSLNLDGSVLARRPPGIGTLRSFIPFTAGQQGEGIQRLPVGQVLAAIAISNQLVPGATGAQVTQAQKFLQDIGYARVGEAFNDPVTGRPVTGVVPTPTGAFSAAAHDVFGLFQSALPTGLIGQAVRDHGAQVAPGLRATGDLAVMGDPNLLIQQSPVPEERFGTGPQPGPAESGTMNALIQMLLNPLSGTSINPLPGAPRGE